MTDLLRDIAGWTLIGVLGAAAIATLMPPNAIAEWGSGVDAMLAILLIGIPMYICATASTPIAASMLVAGVSPGTVLVFLLAGPATNLGSVGIICREVGAWATTAYLAGICVTSIGLGLLLDYFVSTANITVQTEAAMHVAMVPGWFSLAAGMLLPLLVIQPLILNRFKRTAPSSYRQPS